MSTDAVAEIKARLDILEVIGGHVSLHRAGQQHTGLCPFHAEKTPSFMVSQAKQSWYCHGCQEGGDLISFVEKIEGVDFPRALELLAERAGVELEKSPRAAARGATRRRSLELNDRAARFFEYVLWSLEAGAPGRRLLSERGVAESLARRFRVGFAPAGGQAGAALVRYLTGRGGAALSELVDAGLASRSGRDLFRNRLVFPISDERGQVLAFGGRALGDARPKYLNTPETGVYHKSAALFGLEQARSALREKATGVVVEGYFDVIAAHAAGIANVIASSGTALTTEQVRTLARHAGSVVLCFDGDEAGRRAASRAVDLCAAEGLPARIAVMPPGIKDPDELVRGEPAAFPALIAAAQAEWQVLLEWAIGDAGPEIGRRRAAAERAVSVLVRIPEATTRDLYVQEAARRLELSASAMASDVARVRASGARGPVRLAVPAPPAPAEEQRSAAGLASDEPGHPLSSWEEYLATFAVQRPALARVLVGDMGLSLDELVNPAVRRIVELAAISSDTTGLPLHALAPGDRRLAARLSLREVPELVDGLDPLALERAMADCVQQVRQGAHRARLDDIRRRLSVSGRPEGDREQDLAQLQQLIAEERDPRG